MINSNDYIKFLRKSVRFFGTLGKSLSMAVSSALVQRVEKIKGLTSGFSESLIFKQTGSDTFRERRTGKSYREKGRFDECGGFEGIVEI